MGLFTTARKGSKTKKGTTQTARKKKNNATSDNTTVEESRETKQKKQKSNRRGTRNNQGSQEQPSTAMMSDKKVKAKSKNKKTSKKDKNDTTTVEGNAVARAGDMLKALAKPITPNDNLLTPPENKKNNQTTCEDEPVTVKQAPPPPPPPVLVLPPVVIHKDPGNAEPPTAKTNNLKDVVIAPAPDKSLKANSAVTPNSTLSQTDKWAGEAVAKVWLDKCDFAKTKAEFEKLQSITVNVDQDCKKWKANAKLNQSSDDYPALDSNLATFENVYVNMSLVDAQLHRSLLIGQIPMKGNEEAFWKVVFHKQVTSMHIITDQESIEFFPVRSGVHIYHGTMFVNNRRVECVNEDVYRFAIEVLPDGCSNSIICNVTIVKNWNIDSVHAKQAVVIKETIELTNFLTNSAKDETALVLSKHGAGRAGYFVALSVAVYKMDLKNEPSVFDIVKSLRAQRPKSVESLTQYASLYISMFYYIKRKTSKTDGDKKAISDPHDPMCKKAVHLTTLYTNALIAEAAANAGRSTMTMIR